MGLENEIRDRIPGMSGDADWSAAAAGAALVAGLATRALLKSGWRRFKGEDPPQNPAAPTTGWGEAIVWTVAVSVAVGTARLVARRAAAAAWERVDS